MTLLVRAIPPDGNQSVGPVVEVHAVRAVDEVRQLAPFRRGDERRVATTGRNPHDVGFGSTEARSIRLLKCPRGVSECDDPISRLRPNDLLILCNRRGQLLRRPPVRTHLHDVTAIRAPCHIGDPFTIRRPRRLSLRHVRVGDELGIAVREVHHIQVVESHEGETCPVRRSDAVTDLAHGERRRVFDRVVEIDERARCELFPYPERHRDGVGTVDGNTPDLPAVRGHELA